MKIICQLGIFLMLLSGCAASPKLVKIPVRMPCEIEVPKAPDNCHLHLKESVKESRAAWLKCELAIAAELRGYVLELETALNYCRK